MNVPSLKSFSEDCAHSMMSSAWERIRVRIETKEDMSQQCEPQSLLADQRTISTHILDTTIGKAASNVPLTIWRLQADAIEWLELGRSKTNNDGRATQLVCADEFRSGVYKLRFEVGKYFSEQNVATFYPFIEIVVECVEGQHYHIPLLLNPYGYTTYRGS